nr:alanine and glycine-rich protein-like [Aegilops tauschii subsp. strangulata]
MLTRVRTGARRLRPGAAGRVAGEAREGGDDGCRRCGAGGRRQWRAEARVAGYGEQRQGAGEGRSSSGSSTSSSKSSQRREQQQRSGSRVKAAAAGAGARARPAGRAQGSVGSGVAAAVTTRGSSGGGCCGFQQERQQRRHVRAGARWAANGAARRGQSLRARPRARQWSSE